MSFLSPNTLEDPRVAAPRFTHDQHIAERLLRVRETVGAELSKTIVGQHEVIEQILIALLSAGHCLITGAPGLAKTLLVKSIAQVFDLRFQRIQFTPDLMPADITGTEILQDGPDGRRMVFVRGPLFGNIILADEINRTPPKTQAALLEAMQEHQVTAAGIRHPLDPPFFVLATQNPVEMEGTYPLPEAQLDRFMFNVLVDYLSEDQEVQVVARTTEQVPGVLQPLFTSADVLQFHELVRKVPIAEAVVRYAVRLAAASRPHQSGTPKFISEWVNWGAGTRAGQCLVLAAKAAALLVGRAHATTDDVRRFAGPVLRHRILLNYRAEAEGVTVDHIIHKLLETVNPAPKP